MKKILLIDDDPTFRFFVRKLLEKHSPEVHLEEAGDGEAGIQKLDLLRAQHESPDVVLLDLNMNVADGWDFLNAFQKLFQEQEQPIIYIVTSSISVADQQRAKDAGSVSGYIVKPIDRNKLQKIINGDRRDFVLK